ncbi:MAG TPA: tRNA adenosine deaminase-associated protein [Micromonosporaceae bacterium]|nr:tRNA adenosine deaminase-associated protein [Micromonosporaceae bacterium]
MSYFAAAVARHPDGWSAVEVSLADAADVEDVADRLRDATPGADVSLLFVESEDAYLAILRLDQGEDLRIFGSDRLFAQESRLGALLLADVGTPLPELAAVELAMVNGDGSGHGDDDPIGDETDGLLTGSDVDPVGDPEILADLGIPASKLLELCGQEGMLPSDITAELCQMLGCGEEVEELRVA